MLIAVVGTGTGVGKTFATCALAHEAVGRGWRTAGRKPIESGVEDLGATDMAAVAAAGDLASPSLPPFLFRDPVSPHLAARREGRSVDVALAAQWARASSSGAEVILVETAGGLLSPLGRGLTNLDLVHALAPDHVVVVGVDRLGVLHDLAAVRHVMGPRLWAASTVVLFDPEPHDASTGSNADELVWLGLVAQRPVTAPRDTTAFAAAVLDRAGLVSRWTGSAAPTR